MNQPSIASLLNSHLERIQESEQREREPVVVVDLPQQKRDPHPGRAAQSRRASTFNNQRSYTSRRLLLIVALMQDHQRCGITCQELVNKLNGLMFEDWHHRTVYRDLNLLVEIGLCNYYTTFKDRAKRFIWSGFQNADFTQQWDAVEEEIDRVTS